MIQDAVEAHDYRLHDGKTDVVNAGDWVEHAPRMQTEALSFETLVDELLIYLVVKPASAGALRAAFRDAGFALPFARLTTQVRYGLWQKFASSRIKRAGAHRVFWVLWSGISGLIATAERVREKVWQSFKDLRSRGVPAGGMRRRWYVQRCRYLLNRLLYLVGPERYGEVQALVPGGSEFVEHRVLLEALVNRDPRPLLPLPGQIVAAFCEVASEQSQPAPPDRWPSLCDRASSESAAILCLYFGWTVPESTRAGMYPGSRLLLEILTANLGDRQLIERQTYLDEIELLLRGASQEQLTVLAKTRFAEREGLGLEGLSLGGGYHS